MRIFFSLAERFRAVPNYEENIRQITKTFDLQPVFLHDAPSKTETGEWIAAALADCQFAFFDLTGFAPDVLFALGVASQNDDVTRALLIDVDEHESLAGPLAQSNFLRKDWSPALRNYIGPADFARKASMTISEAIGPSALLDQRLVGRIKEETRRGPLPMRKIATIMGRSLHDIQPVVYGLVRTGALKKISDKRWAKYEATQ